MMKIPGHFFGRLTCIFLIVAMTACGQAPSTSTLTTLKPERMKVEIWSDVMCPFCYIGKRKFEQAMAKFEHRQAVEVEWKSFQLNPALQTDAKKNINEYLSEIKGWSLEQSRQMNLRVTAMAKEAGLTYDFDKAV